MAWHFIRNSFKIYLTVNPIVAAKRVMADCQRDSEQVMEDVYEKSLNLLERRAAEDKRFKSIYGVDCGDLNNYDLVVDTTNSSVEIVQIGSDSFIIKGHENVSAALVNKVELIPVIILAKDVEEIHPGEPVSQFIKSAFNLNLLSEWEAFHGFQFETYPKIEVNS